MGFKIGSFNLRQLGLGALDSKNDKSKDRDLRKIAEIIREENFDIVALQEVQSEGKAFWSIGTSSKSGILYELGPNWEFWPRQNCNERNNTDFAFLWNTRTIKLSEKTNKEAIITVPPTNVEYTKNKGEWCELIRTPIYARFTPLYVPKLEIRLINIHLKGPDFSVEDRRREFNTVVKQILDKYEDKRYADNKETITIVLGDYNLNLRVPGETRKAYLDEFVEFNGKMMETTQSLKTTVKNTDSESEGVTIQNEQGQKAKDDYNDLMGNETDYWANNYDHFTFNTKIREKAVIQTDRVEAIAKYCGRNEVEYRERISDHVPIVMNIDINSYK